MRNWGYKTFKDNIHGYLKIPKPFVDKLIDTEVFQRLRYIEQTGMRTLYPSARHDRFIHSLGTYHLGVKAYRAFQENVKRHYSNKEQSGRNHYLVMDNEDENKGFWEELGVLFSIACLLHDCGHAPFSHTLEYIYDMGSVKTVSGDISELNSKLLKQYNSDAFTKDFANGVGKEHERMSALLVKSEFGDAIKSIMEFGNSSDEEIEFIARAIIGCQYSDTSCKKNQIKNCTIQLLNSSSIDVDKLDYIVRDATLSGFDNTAIDIDRLIDSLTIVEITHFDKCKLDNFPLDSVILNGTLMGKIDANVSGVMDAVNFKGTMNGQICINGLGQITKEAEIKNGYIKIGGTLYKKATEILEPAKLDIDAEFSDDLKLMFGSFKSKDQMNAKIISEKDSQVIFSSVYLKGSVSGAFNGDILGYFDEFKDNVKVVPAFHKSSLSVLQNVVSARNYEYLWIYSHHKVAYYSNYLLIYVLRRSIKFVLKKLYDATKTKDISNATDMVLQNIVSMDYVYEWNNRFFYRSNDSDFIAFFKDCYIKNKENKHRDSKLDELYNEFFSRKYKRSVWKSYAEFCLFFGELTDQEKKCLLGAVKDNSSGNFKLYGFFNEEWSNRFSEFGLEDVVWVNADVSMRDLKPEDTFILIKGKPIRYKDVSVINTKDIKINLFYLYYSGDLIEKDNFEKLIFFLKEKAKEKAKTMNG